MSESGSLITKDQLNSLSPALMSLLPAWYIDLLLTFPLAGGAIDIPHHFGQEEYIGKPVEELLPMTIQLHTWEDLQTWNIEMFPGCELTAHQYVCIGHEPYSTQEGIFIHAREEDPRLLLVFHDIGDTALVLIDNVAVLLEWFSDMFRVGRAEDRRFFEE